MHRQGSRAIVSPCCNSSRHIAHSPASLLSTSSEERENEFRTIKLKEELWEHNIESGDWHIF